MSSGTLYGTYDQGGSEIFFTTINQTTGEWDLMSGTQITIASGIDPRSIAWDCVGQVMYGFSWDQNNSENQLNIVDTSTSVWTPVGSGQVIMNDSVTDATHTNYQLLCNILTLGTYAVDKITGNFSFLGSPGLANRFFLGLTHDCNSDTVYGVSWNQAGNEYFLCTIDVTNGAWTELGLITNINTGSGQMVRGLAYDSDNDILYFTFTDNITYTLNTSTYVANGVGISGVPPTGSTRAIEYVPNACCVCVKEGTVVSVVNGPDKKIENLTTSDVLIDNKGKETEIKKIVKSWKSERFVVIKKNSFRKGMPFQDIFIKHDHPILYQNQEIPCQFLIGKMRGVEEVMLSEKKSVYTIITKSRKFVNMSGIYVGTWSQQDFKTNSEFRKMEFDIE